MISGDRIVATLTVAELREVLADCAPVSAPATAPALLDRAGLAKSLGTSLATVDRLRAEPGFPQLKLGDSPRFETERVVAWLRARAHTTDDANVVQLRAGGSR